MRDIMNREIIRVLGLPFRSAEAMVEANVDGALQLIAEELRKDPVDIVVLPELFTCGYCAPCLAPYAEAMNGPTMRKFQKYSDELGVAIGYGFAEVSGTERVYNSWAFLEPGVDAKVYRKMHLHPSKPSSPANEKDFLLPGDSLEPLATRMGWMGVMLCYDGCFVEVPRTLALKGADFIVWPTRSGCYLASHSLTPVRALDNTLPIIQVEGGQTGAYMPLSAWSSAASATGNVLASRKDYMPFRVELDIEEGRRLRASSDAGGHSLYVPRRPELYGAITEMSEHHQNKLRSKTAGSRINTGKIYRAKLTGERKVSV